MKGLKKTVMDDGLRLRFRMMMKTMMMMMMMKKKKKKKMKKTNHRDNFLRRLGGRYPCQTCGNGMVVREVC